VLSGLSSLYDACASRSADVACASKSAVSGEGCTVEAMFMGAISLKQPLDISVLDETVARCMLYC
jgi:hypothetical protein